MYEGEREFLGLLRRKARNTLAVIGALALVAALVFGGHTYKALVMYHLYLNGPM